MIQPIFNNVLLKKIEPTKTTASGIALAETKDNFIARVIAVGYGKKSDSGENIPMSIKIDDIVLYKQHTMHEIEIDSMEYLIGPEENILAIMGRATDIEV